VRLALLVHGEAARTGQAAALTGQVPLRDVARRLAVVGDRLWSGPGLPARDTGYDPAILAAR
jgi:hypothetical protein